MDSAPYLNTLSTRLGTTLGKIECHASRQPIRVEHGKNPSTSSANQNRVLRHPSRQPIRIEYYVVITSPESSQLGLKTLLGSRLESARYSLSYYIRVFNPPVLISSHSYYSRFSKKGNLASEKDIVAYFFS